MTHTDTTFRIVAIVGSLRKDSLNRQLMKAAIELSPIDVEIYEAPIADLPLFNEDIEFMPPRSVERFRQEIRDGDAVLFITPEYNYSIPGVLKNAIDWGSRPPGKGVFTGKPGTVIGAAGGRSGTMRAQLHMRQIFVTLNVLDLNKPEVFVTFANDQFDDNGKLINEQSREQLTHLLTALRDWGRLVRPKE